MSYNVRHYDYTRRDKLKMINQDRYIMIYVGDFSRLLGFEPIFLLNFAEAIFY